MKCRQIEKLLIETTDELDEHLKSVLEEHISQCKQCATFAKNLQRTRRLTQQIKTVQPPAYLTDRTFQVCNKILLTEFNNKVKQNFLQKIPGLLRIIIAVLIILTLIWATAILKMDPGSEAYTQHVSWAVIVFIQNLLTLLFIPLFLRCIKQKMYERHVPVLYN